jgi:hypothetical protein
LKTLYDLARKGLIDEIIVYTENMEQSEERYRPFVKKIRSFAQDFQIKQIRTFIKQYLKEE